MNTRSTSKIGAQSGLIHCPRCSWCLGRYWVWFCCCCCCCCYDCYCCCGCSSLYLSVFMICVFVSVFLTGHLLSLFLFEYVFPLGFRFHNCCSLLCHYFDLFCHLLHLVLLILFCLFFGCFCFVWESNWGAISSYLMICFFCVFVGFGFGRVYVRRGPKRPTLHNPILFEFHVCYFSEKEGLPERGVLLPVPERRGLGV